MPSLSIASLESQSLIAAQKVVNEQSFMYPLFQHFPRKGYDAKQLEIRIKRILAKVGRFTTADGGAYLIRPGSLDRIFVEPLFTRPMERFSNSDLKLFRAWDQVIQSGGGPNGNDVAVQAGQRLAEFVDDVSSEGRETIHDMLAGALLGSFTYEIDGVEATVDYGHNDCGADHIAVVWTDAAAPIVTDLAEILDEYLQHAGVPADTIYYNPQAWARYFIGNTQFATYVQAVPGLAQAFAGVRQGLEVVDNQGRFIDPFWNLNWVPIMGPHIDRDGDSVQRWPVKSMALTTERADMKRVLEHSMTLDEYNPTAMWNWETFKTDEPKGSNGRYADNGAGSVLIPERVQIIDVEPTL